MTTVTASDRTPGTRSRRLGLGAAAIIVGYALVVGAISAGLIGTGRLRRVRPPATSSTGPLVGLFLLPAVDRGHRRHPSLTTAAGRGGCAGARAVVHRLQRGHDPVRRAGDPPDRARRERIGAAVPRRAVIGALAVVALGIGAWIVPFALTETSCWIARTGPDGAIVYTRPRSPTHRRSGRATSPRDATVARSRSRASGWRAVLGIGAAAMAALAVEPGRPIASTSPNRARSISSRRAPRISSSIRSFGRPAARFIAIRSSSEATSDAVYRDGRRRRRCASRRS